MKLWGSTLCFLILFATHCFAQGESVPINLFIDEQFSTTLREDSTRIANLDEIITEILLQQQLKGYYLATLDSVTWNEAHTAGAIYVQNGPLLQLEGIRIEGAELVSESELLALLDTRPGNILQSDLLASDMDRILNYYESRGFPFVKVSVSEMQVTREMEQSPGVSLGLQIEEGGQVQINDVLVVGAERTRQAYIEYLIGFRKGDVLREDLEAVRNKLIDTEHFVQVSPIELIEVGGGEYIAVVQVREDVPGAFDLVLGYQPPVNTANSGGLVGNGHLDLRNMFGMGRRISLRLNRLPGQISSLQATYADPYFWGSPLSLEGGFHGIQQDSTYNQQSYRAALGYRLFEGVDIFATLNREVVRPGQSGSQFVIDRQRIARSEVTFWGFEIRYKNLDSGINPRRGIELVTGVEGGRKNRSEFLLDATGDTTRTTQRLQQQRLNVMTKGFIPVFDTQAIVLGNETRILVSDEFDVSDLFRIGGAQSLRGYDEERFRGRTVSRFFFEWRYLFERTSYAYIFFDAGYVDRPKTVDFEKKRNIYPGYGLGIQFQTGIGLINTSLALSTLDAPSQAKVHVGLSLGL